MDRYNDRLLPFHCAIVGQIVNNVRLLFVTSRHLLETVSITVLMSQCYNTCHSLEVKYTSYSLRCLVKSKGVSELTQKSFLHSRIYEP